MMKFHDIFKTLTVVMFVVIMTGTAIANETVSINYQNSVNANLAQSIDPTEEPYITGAITPTYTETSPYDIPSSGLIGWWRFDTNTGNVAVDSSSITNNGAYINNPSLTPAKYNNGVSLSSASTQCIGVTHNAAYDYDGDFTIISTVTTTTAADQGIVSNGDYQKYGYELYRASTGTINYRTYQTGAKQTTIFNAGTLSNTQVCLIVSGGVPTLYIDNVLASVSSSQTHSTPTAYTQNLSIGARNQSGIPFNGVIDNVIIYNRAINAAERNQIYYDNVEDMRIKTNTNSNYGSYIDGSGTGTIPCTGTDNLITGITSNVPSSVTINGVVVYDYTRSVTPFNVLIGVSPFDSDLVISDTRYLVLAVNESRSYNFTTTNTLNHTVFTVDDVIYNITGTELITSFEDSGFHYITAYGVTLDGRYTDVIEWDISVNRELATEHEGYFDEKNYNNFIDNLSEWNSTGMIEVSVTPFTDLIGRSFYIILFVLPFVLMWMMQKKITIPTVMALITGCLFIGFIPDQYRAFLTYAVILGFAACFYWIGKERN